MKNITALFKIALAILAIALVSCTKDKMDSNNQAIKFDKTSVNLLVDKTVDVTISGGDQKNYAATAKDASLVRLEVKGNQLTIQGLKKGETDIEVRSAGKSATLKAVVSEKFVISQSEIVVLENKEILLDLIGSEGKKLTLEVKDSKIAQANLEGQKIKIRGLKAGKTTLIVSFQDEKIELPVTVLSVHKTSGVYDLDGKEIVSFSSVASNSKGFWFLEQNENPYHGKRLYLAYPKEMKEGAKVKVAVVAEKISFLESKIYEVTFLSIQDKLIQVSIDNKIVIAFFKNQAI